MNLFALPDLRPELLDQGTPEHPGTADFLAGQFPVLDKDVCPRFRDVQDLGRVGEVDEVGDVGVGSWPGHVGEGTWVNRSVSVGGRLFIHEIHLPKVWMIVHTKSTINLMPNTKNITPDQIARDLNHKDMWTVMQYAETHAPEEARRELVMALGYLGVAESNLAATPADVEECRDRVRTAIDRLNMPA